MRKLIISLVIGVTTVGVALPAWAQRAYPPCATEPSEKDEEAARGAFNAGRAAYEEADYARAVDYWRDAYRRACTKHDLLKNIALAYELSKQEGEAIVALRTYLDRVPDSSDHEQTQRKIEVLEKLVSDKKPSPSPQPLPPPPLPPPDDDDTTFHPVPVTPPKGEDRSPAGPSSLGPWLLIGGSVAMTGVGVAGFLANSASVGHWETVCGTGETRSCSDRTVVDQGNSARGRTAGFAVVSWVGIAALGGGILWYLALPNPAPKVHPANSALPSAPKQVTRRMLEIAPATAPGYTGLAVSGTF